jgi:hypothetical protein
MQLCMQSHLSGSSNSLVFMIQRKLKENFSHDCHIALSDSTNEYFKKQILNYSNDGV